MLNCAAEEHGEIGSASADINDTGTKLFFIFGQHRVAGSKLFQDDVIDFQAATLHTLDDILRRAFRAGNHVYLGLETHARHADRLADTFLAVDQKLLRQNMQYFLIGRDGHSPCGVDHAIDIAGADFLVANRNDAVRIQAAHVAAGNAGVD